VKKYLKLYKRNFKGRSVRLRTIMRAATAARCTWAWSRRWAIREHCKELCGKVSTLWTYSPRGALCFGLCPIRLIGAATVLFLRLHCGFNSVAFFLDVAGLVALKLLQNGAAEHEPCIFKFFLLPRLGTRIKEFKIKESVVVCQTTDAERNWMRIDRASAGGRAYSESLKELFLFSVASKFLILRPEKKRSIHDLNEAKGNFGGSLNTLWRANLC